MNVYYCTDFDGHYPVGTSAVVAAETEEQAQELLLAELVEHGLPQNRKITLHRINVTVPRAFILQDGDY